MSDEICPPQTLTIDEIAERLGTNRNRIVRLLARPEFAPLVQTEERVTRTGTRTARVISVLVLPRVSSALEVKTERVQKRRRERDQSEQKQDQREEVYTFSGSVPEDSTINNAVTALTAVIEELRARLSDKDRMLAAQESEILFLRAALEREQENRLNEQRLLASVQQITAQQIIARKRIEVMPVDPEFPEATVIKKNGGSSGAGNDVRARLKLKVIEPCQIPQVRT